MFRVVRPAIVLVLSAVLLTGQMPAMLHVATCHQDAEAVATQSSHACCHCEHTVGNTSDDAKSDSRGDSKRPQPEHGSHDDCAICHSLAAPSGVVITLVVVPSAILRTYGTAEVQIDLLSDERFILPHLRGPPSSNSSCGVS